MMYQTMDFKKGLKIELENKVFLIVEYQHVNPGKGSAFVRTRLKNLETGQVLEKTFKAGVDTANIPNLEEKTIEYTYSDHEGFHFMDQENFEGIFLTKDQVGSVKDYLQEGIQLQLLYHNGKPLNIELPNFVFLEVSETDPGLKGDSAAGGYKKAFMNTGLQISVPLFIKEGDILKIDTRTGEYLERKKQ